MIVSAQLIGQTHLCQAQNCPNDASPRERLCARCQQRGNLGFQIRLHTLHAVDTTPTLPCCTCKRFLPDDAFSAKKNTPTRRHRHQECRECSAIRRRKTRPPDQRVGDAKRERTTEQRKRHSELERQRYHAKRGQHEQAS